jgi:serine phosphatase RsbU (regulator of sigma subunit)
MVQTAAAMASRAAVALENSRLHSTVTTIADALQAGLAPALPPTLPGMRVATRYVAAGAGVEVGGDFYDFVDCGDGRWLLVIGDVAGRGPGAAALNAQVRFAARALARTGLDAAQVATALNDNVVADAEAERFCTAVVVTLAPDDNGIAADLVVAGHPAPIVVRATGTMDECGGDNQLLGVFADAVFTTTSTRLSRGDVLVLVTDGVLEARDPHGEFFDEGRLFDAIRHAIRTAEGIADGVHAAVAAFAPNMTDDLAIVTVEAR